MTTNPQKTRESWVKMDNKKEAPKAKKSAAIEEKEVKKGPKWGILIPLIVILTICGSVGGTVLATHFLAPDRTGKFFRQAQRWNGQAFR